MILKKMLDYYQMYYNISNYIFVYYNMLDSKYNFLLFLLLLCIVKVFNLNDLFIISEYFGPCNRKQKRKMRDLDRQKDSYNNSRVLVELSGEFDNAVDALERSANNNIASAINNEFTKEEIKGIYKEIYNNLAERVAIDNDSIVKANKNEFMDRAEILLGDTPLYQIPEYAE